MRKISILLWMYHNELDEEFYRLLSDTSEKIDVHLSLCSENNNKSTEKLFNKLSNIKSINYYPNIGVDIYSFINDLHLVDNQYFVKLHSKKSRWGKNHRCNWRAMLVDSLIANLQTLSDNAQACLDGNFGSVGLGATIYHKTESLHKDKIREILNICHLNNTEYKFVGGNMFMGETKLFQDTLLPYKDILLKLLSTEKGKVNEVIGGTYCHAMERIFGSIGCKKGLEACPLNTLKIKIYNKLNDSNLQYLNFRIMYNNDIYCIQDPNIYGSLVSHNSDHFEVLWFADKSRTPSRYILIDNNTYANQLYLHGGV